MLCVVGGRQRMRPLGASVEDAPSGACRACRPVFRHPEGDLPGRWCGAQPSDAGTFDIRMFGALEEFPSDARNPIMPAGSLAKRSNQDLNDHEVIKMYTTWPYVNMRRRAARAGSAAGFHVVPGVRVPARAPYRRCL